MHRNNSLALRVSLSALYVLLASALLAGAPEPADPEALVPEEQVNTHTLMPFLKAAFLKCEVLADGALKVEDEGMKTLIKVDPAKKLVAIFSLWSLKAGFSEAEKLSLANRLNKTLIIVRFHVHEATVLVCDYQFSYENGIRPSTFVGAYRLFAKVVKGAVMTQDPDRIIGTDGSRSVRAPGQGV
ncbi:MAG: hypothetical protein FJ290_31575 [Planctomycetes bacterium]|nr:hypothetical protein [Planctomycetota bacterium]